jgi:sugar phosphate isomerase/epimerase
VAVHPSFDELFDAFAPERLHGKPRQRTEWAVRQLKYAAKAIENLGLDAHGTFSGALMWQTVYPWPQRPAGLTEEGFGELARRWEPILNTFDEHGVDVCYEIHPGEDVHDGITYERFLEATENHPRVKILYDPSHFVLQCLDYVEFIDIYHEKINMFHVKDAEFNPTGRSGVYGGYQDWINRPGRFRSTGDGQADFKKIFSKLTRYGFGGWAVLEWECCMKHPEDGAREGAEFISDHIIHVTDKAFDDFAGGGVDEELNKKILGIA